MLKEAILREQGGGEAQTLQKETVPFRQSAICGGRLVTQKAAAAAAPGVGWSLVPFTHTTAAMDPSMVVVVGVVVSVDSPPTSPSTAAAADTAATASSLCLYPAPTRTPPSLSAPMRLLAL